MNTEAMPITEAEVTQLVVDAYVLGVIREYIALCEEQGAEVDHDEIAEMAGIRS